MEQNTKQIRELTKEIRIGDRVIGGSYPILIQSMTNTKTQDVDATVEQILRLEDAGCEIIRCTVPDMEAAKAIGEIKKRIHIPLVADIHFDYRLAIAAMENGADKIRINPGNIGSDERVRAVVEKAKEYHVGAANPSCRTMLNLSNTCIVTCGTPFSYVLLRLSSSCSVKRSAPPDLLLNRRAR